MNKYNWAKESTKMLAVIIFAIGIILIFLEEILKLYIKLPSLFEGIFRVIGTTFISIILVSLVYQWFVREKQFAEFMDLLERKLKDMDSIQSQCIKFGIQKIFENKNAYLQEYRLEDVINQSPKDKKIIAIGRSLENLSTKIASIKEGLKKGLTFELACVNPKEITSFHIATGLTKFEIESSLMHFKKLFAWAIEKKPTGSIELKYHKAEVADSAFIFTPNDNEEKIAWELSFGPDLENKKVIIISTKDALGSDLKSRYMNIYNDADALIKYSNGKIRYDNSDWKFDENN